MDEKSFIRALAAFGTLIKPDRNSPMGLYGQALWYEHVIDLFVKTGEFPNFNVSEEEAIIFLQGLEERAKQDQQTGR